MPFALYCLSFVYVNAVLIIDVDRILSDPLTSSITSGQHLFAVKAALLPIRSGQLHR